jgi:hypothetical protein
MPILLRRVGLYESEEIISHKSNGIEYNNKVIFWSFLLQWLE